MAGKAHPFAASGFTEQSPAFSPDGRILAYAPDESGRTEVYARFFPSADGKWQVSNRGGWFPRWSRAGTQALVTRLVDVGDEPARVRQLPQRAVRTREAVRTGRHPAGGRMGGVLDHGARVVAARMPRDLRRAVEDPYRGRIREQRDAPLHESVRQRCRSHAGRPAAGELAFSLV